MQSADVSHENPLGSFITRLHNENMPVFSRTMKSIIDLSSRDKSSLSDLSMCILKDSSLTAKVLRIANGALYNRDSTKARTVSRAVLQLGFNTVKNMCISSLLIESVTSGPRRDRVITEMMRSFHAAVQARSIALARGDPHAEEIFIATLLYRIGHIAFWCFGGKLADRLEAELTAQSDLPPARVEKSLLGFSLQELTYNIVKEWGLGELLEQSLTKTEMTTKSTNVLLGQTIANGVKAGWDSPKLKQVITATSRFTKLSEEETSKLIKCGTDEAIQSASDYGLGNFIRQIPTSSAPEVVRDETQQSAVPQYNPQVQLEILTELNALIKDKKFNLDLYLVTLLEGISRGIGMRRVILSILSPDKKYLVGRFGIGWDQERVELFRFSTKASFPSVFTELFISKAPVWISGNKPNSKHITEEVKAVMATQHFFAAPLVIKDSVIGAICADCGPHHDELDDRKFNGFEYFINTSNAALSAIF